MTVKNIFVALFFLLTSQERARADDELLIPNAKLHVGDQFANVFSRTIAFTVTGFPDVVRRISGTGICRVDAVSKSFINYELNYRYDGRPIGKETGRLEKKGAIRCVEDSCSKVIDASGTFYNPILWGVPPTNVAVGSSWAVTIDVPWELGTPAKEQITVEFVDQSHGIVSLKRSGEGDGFFSDDLKQVELTRDGKTYRVDVNPGHSKWIGRATFINGVVDNDELIVERPIKVSSSELGELSGSERQYILFNRSPVRAEGL
jgi:hypothetical protein